MARTREFDESVALERAMERFWSHGYEATSVQDLVESMGVNRGSLYATFGDKRDLFERALEHYDAQYRAKRLEQLAEAHPPREAIEAFFRTVVEDSLDDRRRRGCFIVNTALELAAHDAEMQARVARSLKAIEGFFRRLIVHAQDAGAIDPEKDARALASLLLGALLGIRVLARARPERKLLKRIADTALEALS